MNITSTYPSEGDEVGSPLSLPTLIIYISFGAIGVIDNGLVLFVIARVKELQDTTNLFIANQSLIDGFSSILLLAIFVVPRPPLPENNPILARFLCGFWYSQFLYWASLVSSLVNLLILTLERYFAVLYPIRYRRYVSYKLAIGCSLIPWASGFLHMCYLITITKVEDRSCMLFVWPNETLQPGMGIYTFVITFVVPFSVMFFLYARMWQKLREGLSKEDATVHQATDYRNIARKNVLKTMLSLSLCYAVCWAPNQFTYLLYCVGVDINLAGTFYYVTVCISFINIWINPFFYVFQYHKFQRGLKTVFCCSGRSPEVEVKTMSSVPASTSGISGV